MLAPAGWRFRCLVGAVCRHQCWPHPGVRSSRQCCHGRGGRSVGTRVELFEAIRSDRRTQALSIRELAERHKVHRRAVRQALASALPPPRKAYRARPRPAIDQWAVVIDAWRTADKDVHRKQRHTARRVWQRLVAEHGAVVSEVTVSRYVARRRVELDLVHVEVCIPQTHEPGAEAEVDFGEFYATIGGVLVKLWMFVMRLSHSGRAFHVAFGTQAQEAFLEGHVLAFQHFGGVPGRVRYENVPRNIFVLMWPAGLCGRARGDLPPACVTAPSCWALRAHNSRLGRWWFLQSLYGERKLPCWRSISASRPQSIGSGVRGWPRRSRVTWFGWSRIATASRASGVASQSCSSSASSLVHEGTVLSVSCLRKSKRSWPSGSTATTRVRGRRVQWPRRFEVLSSTCSRSFFRGSSRAADHTTRSPSPKSCLASSTTWSRSAAFALPRCSAITITSSASRPTCGGSESSRSRTFRRRSSAPSSSSAPARGWPRAR